MLKHVAALTLTLTLAMPRIAAAHVGVGDTSGVAHGFLHPLTGLDHVLAMVAVGVLAARIGGRGLWAVPLAFVAMMAVGGGLGMGGVPIPLVESGIAVSVVALGVAIGCGVRLTVASAAALAGFFALFHGHAHGAEMPETASGLGYGAGFVLATMLLHGLGIGLGLAIGVAGGRRQEAITRWAGASLSVAGAGLLAGLL